MTKKNYNDWSKEELVAEVEALKKQKTYGLVWEEDKTKEVFDYYINWDGVKNKEDFKEAEGKFPVLKEVKSKDITTEKTGTYNLLIEGDNYHSLAVLNFTHEKAVDVIYIDPPYNTGNKDFKYNDAWVDREDTYRHSKWLSFMEKRLKLAKSLLKETGLIFISIDDNEVAQLKILCDEIFDSNLVAILPTIMNLKGNQDEFGFAGTHEYTLVYCKNIKKCKIAEFKVDEEEMEEWEVDELGYYKKGANLKSTGVNAPRQKRPNLFYPVYITKDNVVSVTRTSKTDVEIYPITDGKEMSWRWEKKKVEKDKHDIIVVRNGEGITLYKKQRPSLSDLPSKKPKTIFYKPEYSSGNGTNLLLRMFGEKIFSNPKPVELIKDFIRLGCDKEGVVLDFMAGSGTTAHAVLELNVEDDCKRQFILCTNNEVDKNTEDKLKREGIEKGTKEYEAQGICQKVCYPRVERVMNGYTTTPNGETIRGLGGNLKYFKTDFVASASTDKNRKKIVEKSTEMICIKENAFELVKDRGEEYKIFKNHENNLGIIFNSDAIDPFVKEAKKIEGKFHVYVFSLDDTVPEYEFRELRGKVKLCAIPAAILHVYRRVFAM